MSNTEIAALLKLILDKLNRIEANAAHNRQDQADLNSAIDKAVEKLSVPMRPTRW